MMRNAANQLVFAGTYEKREKARDPPRKKFGNASRCRSHYKRELVTGTPSITRCNCGRFISGDYPRINLRSLIFVVAPRSSGRRIRRRRSFSFFSAAAYAGLLLEKKWRSSKLMDRPTRAESPTIVRFRRRESDSFRNHQGPEDRRSARASLLTSNSPSSVWFAIEREVTLGVQTATPGARAIVARRARRTWRDWRRF